MTHSERPILALTQGDPAGIGPEIILRVALETTDDSPWRPLLVAERAALEACASLPAVGPAAFDRLRQVGSANDVADLPAGAVAVLDPIGDPRLVTFGSSGPADATGAMAALDAGLAETRAGRAAALVTAPVSKRSIAAHGRADFRGHTDYLAQACGLERYGRDYLMAFLSADLRVALLSTHVSTRDALAAITEERLGAALDRLASAVSGRIAVASVNPHAGEGGLMGDEDARIVQPAVAAARARGIDVRGPESADSVFARARRGEFDWVLALYHDQGLIAVKTAAFGTATNWTLGLPILRTSVDHGTAFDLAGSGRADIEPLRRVVATTLDLLSPPSRR